MQKRKTPSIDWKPTFDKLKQFRIVNNQTPVDLMGCERLADQNLDLKTQRYQTLVSLQLSSQTKDQVNAVAVRNLQQSKNGLTVDSILEMSDKELNDHICKVGFHNRKTIHLKKTAEILKRDYNSDIPRTAEELMQLPGVGPKMAYLAMKCAWKEPHHGIGVDVHVNRICNRLGWTSTKTPEETRKALEDFLPVEHWGEVNQMLVGFGQIQCKPINPLCDDCPVKEECPKIGVKRKKAKKYM